MTIDPLCPYCGKPTRLVTGAEVYPGLSHLHRKAFWMCKPCRAWVGCHPGTKRPLGTPAGPALRRARQRAHEAFDALWKCGPWSRNGAYRWLASVLGMDVDDCHIGRFDVAQCERVVAEVAAFRAAREVAP